jgi:hypothetical protein
LATLVLIAVILPPQNTGKALKRRDSSDPGQNKQEKATVSRQEIRRQESSKPTLEGIVAAYITEDVEKQGVRCGSMRVVEAKPGETSSE